MQALTYWKTVTMDKSDLLEKLITLLAEHNIRYCVIGGQAVNAYVEPLVSLDLHLVVAGEQLADVSELLATHFTIKRFPHSLNVSIPGSNLRVQIQQDARYFSFVERASIQEVLGLPLPVAIVEDVLQGKIWAYLDPERRQSKRFKDLADITRLLESYPELRKQVPPEILSQIDGE
jgi:hypothetical protein